MKNLRQDAKGKPCMIRVPGYCNGNPETTVLCHYRLAGTSGAGMKPDDEQASWGCSDCHDVVDERRKTAYSHTECKLMLAEGMIRTQYARRHGLYA